MFLWVSGLEGSLTYTKISTLKYDPATCNFEPLAATTHVRLFDAPSASNESTSPRPVRFMFIYFEQQQFIISHYLWFHIKYILTHARDMWNNLYSHFCLPATINNKLKFSLFVILFCYNVLFLLAWIFKIITVHSPSAVYPNINLLLLKC